jgi:hypothetical protein
MTKRRNFYQTHNIHPSVPRRLIRELHRVGWSQRELSRLRKVNQGDISRLLKKGIEPTDATEHGREIRVRMYLPKHKRKPRAVKELAPAPSLEWWERVEKKAISVMVKKTKSAVIRKG